MSKDKMNFWEFCDRNPLEAVIMVVFLAMTVISVTRILTQ